MNTEGTNQLAKHTPRPVVGGLSFAEGPRWHRDRLWFSDMHGEAICTVTPDGTLTTVLDLPGREPSGLGFLPNGDLLFVSMSERTIQRFDGASESTHADLSSLTDDRINDMVVDASGRAYVGSFPTDRDAGVLILVEADGTARVVADRLDFPNGTVITGDGRTLIVTESRGRRHTAFDIAQDGSLGSRRVYAALEEGVGDGLALDAKGALWSALPLAHQFVRLLPGGTVTDRIDLGDRMPIACAFGGPDRRSLYLLSATDVYAESVKGTRNSRIDVIDVDVPGAGTP